MTVVGWLAAGGIADIVLATIALEFAVVVAVRRSAAAAATALLPGALLVLALRAALAGADLALVASLLALSLPAHLADLHRRGWLPPILHRRDMLRMAGKKS